MLCSNLYVRSMLIGCQISGFRAVNVLNCMSPGCYEVVQWIRFHWTNSVHSLFVDLCSLKLVCLEHWRFNGDQDSNQNSGENPIIGSNFVKPKPLSSYFNPRDGLSNFKHGLKGDNILSYVCWKLWRLRHWLKYFLRLTPLTHFFWRLCSLK